MLKLGKYWPWKTFRATLNLFFRTVRSHKDTLPNYIISISKKVWHVFRLLSTILSQLWEDNWIETDKTWCVNTYTDRPVADRGEAPGGPASPSPLFLDQTEARRAEKKLFTTGLPPYLRVWMTALPPPPPYLKVWIPHCSPACSECLNTKNTLKSVVCRNQ